MLSIEVQPTDLSTDPPLEILFLLRYMNLYYLAVRKIRPIITAETPGNIHFTLATINYYATIINYI